uniref:Uncharacterized protein n=1 Tax=Anopheles farauti TaxID=69004 RepID=A0A182Q5N0_9DIPT
MNAPRNGSKLCDLRHKLFGPTLDDSVLYGVDRMIDCFQTKKSNTKPVKVESFYRSCESLHPIEKKFTLSQLDPKLSPLEMDYIIDAVGHAREKSQSHARGTSRTLRYELQRSLPAPKLRQSRWAIARINEYDDGTQTYEIMNPLPAVADTEIVFALLPNGIALSYRTQR